MRIVGLVIRAERAAQHDKQRRIERIGRIDARAADIEIADQMAALTEHEFETSEVFEMDMANRQDFIFHRRFP